MDKWNKVYIQNLPIYMQLIENYFARDEIKKQNVSVEHLLDKLPFKLPKGLTKKEIKKFGQYPVVSQSKELIVGYSDFEKNVISTDLPLIIYGDHSKTIKFIDFPFVVGADGVKLLKPKKDVDPKYFYYSLIGLETDTKNYGRHFSFLKKKLLAIPLSLEVQGKVVKFIEDLEVNGISKGESYFSSQIEKIIESLQNNSIIVLELNDELTHQKTLLKQLRQQILQEAIEGKLTADWRAENPNVEPASELLKRIAAEKAQLIKEGKIKKQKPLPPISEEEKPFELPQGWEWCRLEVIANLKSGNQYHYPKTDSGVMFVKVGDMNLYGNEYEIVTSSTYFHLDKIRKQDLIPCGSIIFPKRGGAISTNKRRVVLKEPILIDSNTMAVTTLNNVGFGYFKMWFDSIDLALLGNDSVVPQVNNKDINPLVIPLPPLYEQHAIVTKVEKLLALCDQLETQINQNQSHADQLMQAVLREAFRQNNGD
ncbi:hypothetical protein D5085_07590 [Ectothiorhodospiraceae bacterium BW-2]|nr:hypothetical protein D5085_07590 [Ectothiorhodospiraceae bacterium BW-2]